MNWVPYINGMPELSDDGYAASMIVMITNLVMHRDPSFEFLDIFDM